MGTLAYPPPCLGYNIRNLSLDIKLKQKNHTIVEIDWDEEKAIPEPDCSPT